jgi:hypothetical protein
MVSTGSWFFFIFHAPVFFSNPHVKDQNHDRQNACSFIMIFGVNDGYNGFFCMGIEYRMGI